MNKLKISLLGLMLCLFAMPLAAQTTSREEYQEKYGRMSGKFGPSGPGLETLINYWIADYPEDVEANLAKFLYYYSKSQKSEVVGKTQKKYLGLDPILTLADSLGKVTYYYEDLVFDDDLFGESMNLIDNVIRMAPDRIDLRFYKVAALVGYEKEFPELALTELRSLVDYDATVKPAWVHPEYVVDKEFFLAAVQEYCIVFFKYATPVTYEAFKQLTQRILDYYPNETMFINNMGSYNFICKKDYKTALKFYNKALKLKPGDNTAIRSGILVARQMKDTKLEKKYLAMMAQYGESETDRQSASVRLDYLNGKK